MYMYIMIIFVKSVYLYLHWEAMKYIKHNYQYIYNVCADYKVKVNIPD